MCNFCMGRWFRRFGGPRGPFHQALGRTRRPKLDLDGLIRQFWDHSVGSSLPDR